MSDYLSGQTGSARKRVASLLASYSFNRPLDLAREMSQRLDELDRNLGISVSHLAEATHHQHGTLMHRLEALSPRGVLRRGYAVVRKQGKAISSVQGLARNDKASIQLQDGTAETRVEEIRRS